MGFEADALRLRRAIRDLVAVSTVPAVWADREPRAICSESRQQLSSVVEGAVTFLRATSRRAWHRSDVWKFR